MTSETADELALARCVTSGDEDALNALYERYADPLFAFIYHHLEGARPDVLELRQQLPAAGDARERGPRRQKKSGRIRSRRASGPCQRSAVRVASLHGFAASPGTRSRITADAKAAPRGIMTPLA